MISRLLCLVDKKDAPRNACGTTLSCLQSINFLSTGQVDTKPAFFIIITADSFFVKRIFEKS